MIASSVRAQPAVRRRRVLGVVGGQASVVGLVHHEELDPARTILLIDLDTATYIVGYLSRPDRQCMWRIEA